ncbi:MAG: PDZ domain-containing protein, partial [Candidatus Bathyarchaeia archaeon]
LGFAIPSSTILREIKDLVTTGSYNKHPTLGASGTDMNYEIAKVMGVNVTYGWLIAQVTSGGPAATAGLRGGTRQVTVATETVIVGGDIIIAINGVRIRGIDDLSSYLEENTLPGQTITVTAVRGGETITVSLKLGARPPTT